MEGEKSDLKRFLGSNYLIKFSEDVDTLLAAYSQYVTVEMEAINSSEVDMNNIYQYSDTLRTYVLRAWISYRTLYEVINKENSEADKTSKIEIDKIILSIKKNRIAQSSEIETFLISINTYLFSEPIRKLMDNAQNTMNEMFKMEKDAGK